MTDGKSRARWENAKRFSGWIVTLILLFSTVAIVTHALTPAFTTGPIGPGSFVEGCSYILFTDGTNSFSRNCLTGAIDFTGSSAATVLQQTVNAMEQSISLGGTYYMTAGSIYVYGLLTLSSSIDLTGDSSLNIIGMGTTFPSQDSSGGSQGTPGTGAGQPASGFILAHNGVGFDLTAARNIQFNNIEVGVAAGYTPTIGFLMARPSTGGSFGWHNFNGDTFQGNLSIGWFYNYGSEQVYWTNCYFRSGHTDILLLSRNLWGVTSAFRTISTGTQSESEFYILQTYFTSGYVNGVLNSAVDAAITVDRAIGVKIENTFSALPNNYLMNFTGFTGTSDIAVENTHFEYGGIWYMTNPTSPAYFYNFRIRGVEIGNQSVPNARIIDMGGTNVRFFGMDIQDNDFPPANIIWFGGYTYQATIHFIENPQIYLYSYQFLQSYIRVYNGSKVVQGIGGLNLAQRHGLHLRRPEPSQFQCGSTASEFELDLYLVLQAHRRTDSGQSFATGCILRFMVLVCIGHSTVYDHRDFQWDVHGLVQLECHCLSICLAD